jgi:transcription termination factor Rho
VVLLVDSLSRLTSPGGEGARVKKIFGAGRELAEEDAGSLTVIATTLDDSDDEGSARAAVETTENALIRLDPELAGEGVYPALAVGECRASGEEELRGPEELEAARKLRDELADLDPAEAARALRERIEATETNAELLSELK